MERTPLIQPAPQSWHRAAWLASERKERSAAVAGPRLALAAIVGLAALLRFSGLGAMRVNPFYDAAVRSMGSSWHAFLVGAFNPNASIAVDKPPLDLWLQVASTKVFGFSAFALHLPQALASTVGVVLLYDFVRRTFGTGAGLAAAAAFAVLPAEVLTARSDTMDAWMATLLILTAWLVLRAVERGRGLYLAGIVAGIAFETKLFEALVPLPALVLLFLLGSSLPMRSRVKQLAAAGGAMVGIGLAWALLFATLQARAVPYPLGSADGTIWNTMFVFNGVGRVTGSSTASLLDKVSPPGLGRLFAAGPLHLDLLVGRLLIATLGLAALALLLRLVRRRSLGRIPFAVAVSTGFWLLLAGGLLSFMSHVPVRYLEPLTPAVAAVFGIAASLITRAGLRQARPLALALSVLVVGAILVAPASESFALVAARSDDGGALGSMPRSTTLALSRYLRAHQGNARYEFAVTEAHIGAQLIIADARPVLVLAGTPYHPLVNVAQLAAAARDGSVRYALLSDRPSPRPVTRHVVPRTGRARLPDWVRVHGVDVTRAAGIHGYGMLYRLPQH